MSRMDPEVQRRIERLLAKLEQEAGQEDFSMRATYTYLLGVYLGVNALRDAFLLVEGPDCTYMKAQYIQGNHDWLSTLTSVSGFHRIANTALHPSKMTESRETPLREMMERMAEKDAVGSLLLTSMPMASVTAVDYQRLCRDVSESSGKEVLHVPGLSLSGDWLDGDAQMQNSLAKDLELPEGKPRAEKVAVVGYLCDRNEEDHAANLRVLDEMCAALGLELVSVWLSGQSWADLKKIKDAGTILSLPYGRAAARRIAKRTGAEIIELPLPFGLKASEHWMKTLGERFDAGRPAQEYIDRQMARIAPRLEWLIPFSFQNLETGYVGDPHLLPGLKDIIELLGGRLRFAVITNRPTSTTEMQPHAGEIELLVYPRHREFIRFLLANTLEHDVGLLVANNYGAPFPLEETAIVEFGFPSIFTHALYDRPFLGYPGFLAFVDTLANALRQKELARARAALLKPGSE
jgi:nitrogenase molybdenum-iron protein alpha/beta subunit